MHEDVIHDEEYFLEVLEDEIKEVTMNYDLGLYLNSVEEEYITESFGEIQSVWDKFFNTMKKIVKDEEVFMTNEIVNQKEKEEEKYGNTKKERMKAYLLHKKERKIPAINVKDYSKDYETVKASIKIIYDLTQSAIKKIVSTHYTSPDPIQKDAERCLKEVKSIHKKLTNDIKDHKRISFLNIDSCLHLLEDSRYNKTEIMDFYTDLYREMGEWHKIMKHISEEEDLTIRHNKMHYCAFLVRDAQTKVTKWIAFFMKREIFSIEETDWKGAS